MKWLLLIPCLLAVSGLSATVFACAGHNAATPTMDLSADESAKPQVDQDANADERDESDNPAYAWLDRIEARGDEIKTLRATIIYDRRQGLLGDQQVRRGSLSYDAGRPPDTPRRFDIHFDRLLLDGQLRQQDRRYTFDGRWLAERDGDAKVFIRRELVAQGEQGRDLLAMGEGPFALPLNLNRKAVTQRFTVALIDTTADDPENSIRLRLTPLPDIRVEQDQIDFWFDRDTLLPIMVHTLDDAEAEDQTIIRLRDVRVDPDIDEKQFNTTPPAEPGWQIEINPLDPDQPED